METLEFFFGDSINQQSKAIQWKGDLKIWLDDLDNIDRAIPEGWVHLKTIWEVIAVLKTGLVVDLSLDHDLVQGYDDGSKLVRYMAECHLWPKNKPTIHSENSVGAAYMKGVIARYGPY